MQRNTLEQEIGRILASLNSDETKGEQDTPLDTELPQVTNEYDVYVEADRITFVKKEAPEGAADDTIPQVTGISATKDGEQPLPDVQLRTRLAQATVLFSLFLICFSLLLQLHIALHPKTATIYLFPRSQTLTLSGTLRFGRLLHEITVSQSQTVNATGHGHQDARNATGFITFYNGSNTSRTLDAGTVFTGSDGIQVATDETVTIPANNPPVDGVATVPADALNPGAQGNIAADDIHFALSSDLTAKNLAAFHGGQDEGDFQIVTQKDITTPTATLKTTLRASMPGALQGQLRNGESLHMLPCSPITTADHDPGDRATQVTVTVSYTCSGVAYNEKTLRANVTQLLTTQAIKKLGAGYTLAGDMPVSVKRATITPRVLLSFSSSGTWVYALTDQVQQHIKALVAGKSKTIALQVLARLPGVESVTMNGVDQNTPLPKDQRNIHIIVIYAV